MTLQNCQQERSRDNLDENIPTTPNTNIEDDKFTLQDQGTQGNVSLALSMNRQPSFCKYVLEPLALALLDSALLFFC